MYLFVLIWTAFSLCQVMASSCDVARVFTGFAITVGLLVTIAISLLILFELVYFKY